jgi:hypothetical protein
MKRFELWLAAAILFSLPVLGFAQATGGSTDTLQKHRKGSGTGTKPTGQAEIRKRGSGNTKKGAGNGNAPKVATTIGATGGAGAAKNLGGSHGDDTPTQAQQQKQPHPRAAKDPDKKK